MNKKKQITLVLFICIIAVISFTSYAIIQQNKKNTPDNNDLTKLAILVDGVKADTFPTKNSGKSFLKAECTNGGRTSWDKENWKLSIKDISGPTECTVNFGTLYADASGAEQPELNNGLIPVTWNGTDWVKADTSKKWYDYDTQWWANAVTVSSSSRSTYTKAAVNTPISMDDIETMWVWIPRYEYQHTNLSTNYAGGTQTQPGAIAINFIKKDTTTPSSNNFTVHDAFWWDDNNNGAKDAGEQLSGIWVAKFEMSTGTTICTPTSTSSGEIGTGCDLTTINPYIKPNETSWGGARIATFWTAIHNNMNDDNNIYGLTSADTHMIKNMEWGAVAYLSQSKYGKHGNANYTGTNREVAVNNCNTYKTGIGGNTVAESSSSTTCTTNTYETEKGQAASTTGNIYGIYDMSGGASEFVMGLQKVQNSSEPSIGMGWSGWSGKKYNGTESNLTSDHGYLKNIGSKYYDLYDYGTSFSDYTRYHKGDATYETAKWYRDGGIFIESYWSFFLRNSHTAEVNGIMSFGESRGDGSAYRTSRPTLVPLN